MGSYKNFNGDHEYNTKKNFDRADFFIFLFFKNSKSARSKKILVLYS